MRYRKIIVHLKRQDWLAAAIDLIIVIIGVVIALQLNDWNQEVLDSESEKQYLISLHDDLSSTALDIEIATRNTKQFYELQSNVLNILEGEDLSEDNQKAFELGLFTFGKMNVPKRYWSHYEEMTSSGMLRKLKSRELKRVIIKAYGAEKDFVDFQNLLSQSAAELFNHVNKHYSPELTLPMSWQDIKIHYHLQTLRTDDELIHRLRNLHAANVYNDLFIRQLESEVADAKEKIEEYLIHKYGHNVNASSTE